ncbi:MAG TPA: acetyl-CoA carboxylase carboxyl transferase subunit alpha, partial [Candidatus Bathyarchaeia archaeon]|nr:acetyl-CoA carboxylase carboxyl transferase subunit alpha [Candidatus Bathyarchaeia archaeon]
IAVADRVYILENAYYSVISPEGCASILWRSSAKAPEAAKALKFTAGHLIDFGIVDGMIPEPQGGAHRDPETVAAAIKTSILKDIDELSALPVGELVDRRYQKFRKMGEFEERAVKEAGA